MATIIGDLAVRIGADTSGLTKGLNQSQKRVKQLGGELRSGATQVASYGAAAAAAGAALAAGLVANSIRASRETANLAKLANTSVNTFQKMAFAAKSVGVEQDKLADILKDTSDRVGDFLATGGGPMADFFENIAPKIGVTAQQFRNLSGPQALQLYVDSLQRANLSQSEMTFYMEAIASDATALVPLLRDGGAAMAEQAAQAERLGIALSDVQSAQIEDAANQMARVGEVLGGFVDQFTAELAPVLAALSRQFIETAENAGGVGEAASESFGYVVEATAFVIDAIEGVKRVIQVLGRTVAIFGLSAKDVMLTLARDIVEFPTAATNELIRLLNNLPGVDVEQFGMSDLGKAIQAEIDLVREAVNIGWADVQDVLTAPLPGTQFKQFVSDAKAASEEAAKAVVGVRQSMIGGTGEGGQSATDRDANEQLQAKLQRIREGNMSELDLLREKLAQENAIINEAKEKQLVGEQEWRELMLQNLQQYEQKQTEIEARQSEQRQRLAEQEQRAKLQGFSNMFGNLSTLMNSESRKQFEIGKAAALAGAVVDGYAAITGAYAQGAKIGGPPLGAAFAAAAGVATAAQINNIRSASFGGGGGGSGGAGSVTQGVNAQAEPVQSLNVSLQGFDPNSLYTGQQVGGLLDALQDEAKDRGLNLLVQR